MANRCDLHPVCDPHPDSGDSTAEDELDCFAEYERKGLLPKQAKFKCQSPHYNEDTVKSNLTIGVVWIKAVPHNGITECWNGVDEETTLFQPGRTNHHQK